MRAVNLLPRDMQQRKSFREEDPAVVVGSALGVIVMIALGAAFFVAHGKANTQQARLTKAQLELAALSEKKRESQKPLKPSAPITPIVPPPAITGQEATWLSAVSTNLRFTRFSEWGILTSNLTADSPLGGACTSTEGGLTTQPLGTLISALK